MHERIARRRNALLARRVAAGDDEITRRIAVIERLCLRLEDLGAGDPLTREIVSFCRVSRLAIARSSPFSERGRHVRSMIGQGCARIGTVIDEAVPDMRSNA
jgi:hypothetical protein